MTKYLLLFLSIQFIQYSAYSQDELVVEWELFHTSPLPNGNAEAWAIGTDPNDHILWGVNKDIPGPFEFLNALLYKIDQDANTIWVDSVASGTFAQQSYNLKVNDELVYLGGRTCRTLVSTAVICCLLPLISSQEKPPGVFHGMVAMVMKR